MQLDFSADYTVWDNAEQVSFASTLRGSSSLDVVPVAKRRMIRGREKSPSGGVYVGYEINWIIPQAVLTPGFVPKLADLIVDSTGTQWTVLTVEVGKDGQTWHLGCVDLVLAADLRDAIDVQQAAPSYDAAGVLVRTWPPAGGTVLAKALPCRVQPLSQDVKEERGIRGGETMYSIHLAQQVAVANVREVRVLWGALVLDVTEYKDGNRIDVLPEITALTKV